VWPSAGYWLDVVYCRCGFSADPAGISPVGELGFEFGLADTDESGVVLTCSPYCVLQSTTATHQLRVGCAVATLPNPQALPVLSTVIGLNFPDPICISDSVLPLVIPESPAVIQVVLSVVGALPFSIARTCTVLSVANQFGVTVLRAVLSILCADAVPVSAPVFRILDTSARLADVQMSILHLDMFMKGT
jgi:hypothetical protein